MQEDNWSEKLAETLRKKQEESPLPYEKGAWEAFEKKRNKIREFPFPHYRHVGIAASIVFFMVIGYFLLSPTFENKTSEKQLSEQVQKENYTAKQYNPEPGNKEGSEENILLPSISEKKVLEGQGKIPDSPMDNWRLQGGKSELVSFKDRPHIFPQPKVLTGKTSVVVPPHPDSFQLSAVDSKMLSVPNNTKSDASLVSEEEAKIKLMAQILDGVEDEKEEERSKISSFFLGFGPGYANRMQNSVASTGSNLGIGFMYDLNVGKKLAVGSGLGVNYYYQTNQSQQVSLVSGLSSPVKESKKVKQLQMDIPIYVRFPLTGKNTLSLQAGFSNLMTFNQQAVETVTFIRQVSVADVTNSSANPPTLKTEQVTQTSELNVPTNKFYPFAMANLGINILVYKSQKTNFLVMPFYHYPLQDISGTGQNPGVTGAVFKVNFGAVRK